MHSSLSVVVLWQTHSMFVKARRDIMLLHSHCLRSCKGKMPFNFCNSIIILLELLSVPVLPCKKQYCTSSFLIDIGALSRHFHCTNQITLLSFFTVTRYLFQHLFYSQMVRIFLMKPHIIRKCQYFREIWSTNTEVQNSIIWIYASWQNRTFSTSFLFLYLLFETCEAPSYKNFQLNT